MNLQKQVIRSLMKLPEGLLLRMAGGEPLSIDGRVIDPRVQLLAGQGAKGLLSLRSTRRPPAIVVSAGFDPRRDRGTEYADRLKAAGMSVTYRCDDRLAHAFTAMSGTLPAAKQACEGIVADVKTVLHASA